jgi:SCY1-like protein 2
LTKLRHPDLLQITEPLEETRSELTFVTEAITGSLSGILKDLSENVHGPGSDSRNRGGSGGPEVDEVEVSVIAVILGPQSRTDRR